VSGALAPPPWTEEAACQYVDPDLWFAGRENWQRTRQAKKICATCPVRPECLEYALSIGEVRKGVWGGMAPKERQAEHRRRKQQAAAAVGGSEAA